MSYENTMHYCLYLFNSALKVSSKYSFCTKRTFTFEDKLFRTFPKMSMRNNLGKVTFTYIDKFRLEDVPQKKI